MDSQTKRTLLAAILMVGIVLGWFRLQAYLYPIVPTTQPAAPAVTQNNPAGGSPSPVPTSNPGASVAAGTASTPTTTSATGEGLVAVSAAAVEAMTIGNDVQNSGSFTNPYEFAAVVSPRGAAVETLTLSRHRREVAKDPRDPGHDPYKLLSPLKDPVKGVDRLSLASRSIKIDGQDVSLDNVIWSARPVSTGDSEAVELETTIRRGDADIIRIRKTFRATEKDPHLAVSIAIENLSDQPHSIILTEAGPCGITRDDARVPYGHVVAALIDGDQKIVMGDHPLRKDVHGAPNHELVLREGENKHTLWAALSNKYFTSIVAPKLDEGETYPTELAQVAAEAPNPEAEADDLTFRYVLNPGKPLAANSTMVFNIDVFCGPKSKPELEKHTLARQRDYYAILSRPDVSMCTFDLLGKAMLWLITQIHSLVGNYGVAIICLVVIVKTILHPLSKRGQLVMTRTQRGMARLKPKLDAINEQFKGDKKRQSEETFKLYRDEGISPAGPLLGCLPMFIQMPIWVALWSMLNTNVDIRHQPFMWWMRDLSSPDALISLPESWHFSIPLLSGMMGGPITSLNILPILMVVTMYAQQKIMQKLTQPENKPAPKLDAHGRPIPDPMAQQQKMMPYMMGFMGLLFYNSPSGLNLYIWVNSLLGVVEQFQIRRVIKHMEEKGLLIDKKPVPAETPGGKPVSPAARVPQQPNWVTRLQNKLEAMRDAQSQRERPEPGRGKKKPRY